MEVRAEISASDVFALNAAGDDTGTLTLGKPDEQPVTKLLDERGSRPTSYDTVSATGDLDR